MKRKVIILVDGENISAKKADRIVTVSNSLGSDIERRVYHRRKDPATREWTQKCGSGDYKEICIPGRPARNKVDHVIQDEARRYMKKGDIDLVCGRCECRKRVMLHCREEAIEEVFPIRSKVDEAGMIEIDVW